MLKEKYPNLTFHDITTTFLTELEINLRDEMRVNTIGINMRNIRSLFNAAIDDNNLPDISLQDYPFRKYKIPSEKTAKRNIDIETIKQIRDTDLTGIPELARDIFMLIFYLIGINIKDLSYLTHNNTINNRITYTRHKGGRFYSIKIEPEAAEIIEKIKGDNYLIKLLDHYKNYTTVKKEINKKLKKVTEKIGMEELKLTTYYARHSWATIARQAGISIDDIGLSLGHSDNETTITRTYIEENTETIDRANRTVLNLLKEPEHDKPAQAPEL